ncbi:MAG: RIP metalloprotease RseP [Pyrinomonadaceae bacterium]
MLNVLIAILAIIFVLGVAINIHEFGHFIIAKLFGMRVEAYSFFGLGPRLFGVKIGHTDYRVSAIPLGAYVKLYGDESNSGLEAADETTEPVPESELYELRPRWQKFLVMLGGPFMNFVLALAIPLGIALWLGVPANPAPIVGFVKPDGAAAHAGIQAGDRIVAFQGEENPSWTRIEDDALLIPEKAVPISVERDGKRLDLTITPTRLTQSGQSAGILDMDPDTGTEPVVVSSLDTSLPAAKDGVQVGDWVKAVNGVNITNIRKMQSVITESKGQPLALSIDRKGEQVTITTHAEQRDDGWLIGIGFDPSLLAKRDSVGLAGAASFALDQNLRILRLTGVALGQVSTGERSARDTLSGPIGIGQAIVNQVFAAGFFGLLPLLMAISLTLGVMNLLPIPMLDGGQIMVLGIEKVLSWFGKTLSITARERIQLTGLGIVLLLMMTTVFFDVSRLLGR